MKAITLRKNREVTFTASSCYINKELLYRLAFAIRDPDGYEYDYTIFDLTKKN